MPVLCGARVHLGVIQLYGLQPGAALKGSTGISSHLFCFESCFQETGDRLFRGGNEFYGGVSKYWLSQPELSAKGNQKMTTEIPLQHCQSSTD